MRLGFPKFNFSKKKEPNYKVMELEAENLKLKDNLIEELRGRIKSLEKEIEYLELLHDSKVQQLTQVPIDFSKFPTRPTIRTMSEASLRLTEISGRKIAKGKGAKDAETINSDS